MLVSDAFLCVWLADGKYAAGNGYGRTTQRFFWQCLEICKRRSDRGCLLSSWSDDGPTCSSYLPLCTFLAYETGQLQIKTCSNLDKHAHNPEHLEKHWIQTFFSSSAIPSFCFIFNTLTLLCYNPQWSLKEDFMCMDRHINPWYIECNNYNPWENGTYFGRIHYAVILQGWSYLWAEG